MAITKEQIIERAKTLNITLTDEEVALFVKLNVFPSSEEDEETDPLSGGSGAQKRIRQLNADKKEADKRAAEAERLLKERTDKEIEDKKQADLAAGKYKEVAEAADKRAVEALAASAKVRQGLQDSISRAAIKQALLESGITSELYPKAEKLFDGKAEFKWTDENAGTFEVSVDKKIIEDFKKENPFLYSDNDNQDGTDTKGRRFKPSNTPKTGTIGEAEVKRLEKSFPIIGTMR